MFARTRSGHGSRPFRDGTAPPDVGACPVECTGLADQIATIEPVPWHDADGVPAPFTLELLHAA